MKKYHKHLLRLQIQRAILLRHFFDDFGKISHPQVSVPNDLRKEVIYRLHTSRTGGYLGIVRTAKEFPKRFYLPGFSKCLTACINNCLSCSTVRRGTKKQMHTVLQPISFERLFPCDMMEIDLVGPFQSPIYNYALSGIDVFFSNYVSVLSLTSAHAVTIANAVVSDAFNTVTFLLMSYLI